MIKVECHEAKTTNGTALASGVKYLHADKKGLIPHKTVTVHMTVPNNIDHNDLKKYRCMLEFCRNAACQKPDINISDGAYKLNGSKPILLRVDGDL